MENETKKCKHCKTDILKDAKVCPNCKKKQGGKLKWIIIAVVVLGVIGAAMGGGKGSTTTQEPKVSDNKDKSDNDKVNETKEETKEETKDQTAEQEVSTEFKYA